LVRQPRTERQPGFPRTSASAGAGTLATKIGRSGESPLDMERSDQGCAGAGASPSKVRSES
ncbi:MAG: hypothetical protein ACK55I_38080, partial [bacterium]